MVTFKGWFKHKRGESRSLSRMKEDYERLLKRAHSLLPREVLEHKRFEVPRVRSGTIGMRTYIVNFKDLADALNRDPQHLSRYLSREMATAGSVDGVRAIFQGRFRSDALDRLVQRYVEEFVMCPVCKRPDTKIVKERRFSFLQCEACGAKSSVRTI